MKKLHAVNYRNMRNAIHGLLVYKDKKLADVTSKRLSIIEDVDDADFYELEIEDVFSKCETIIDEIDFRDIKNNYYSFNDSKIQIVNNVVYDLYL